MKCDICGDSKDLLTTKERNFLRSFFVGVDFYNALCIPCWDIEKVRE
jgi:hypothetical protein